MSTNKLAVAGYPHLSLASQEDAALQRNMLALLQSAGFSIGPDRVVPPENFESGQVIAAITDAFRNVTARAPAGRS